MLSNSLLNSQSILQGKRLPWVDYAKGIAIVLVVYRHVLIGFMRSGLEVNEYLMLANEMVFSFRMPLFFIISGIFIEKSLNKRSLGSFTKYKFNTILYPYLIWTIIQVSLQVVLSSYTNADRGVIDYLYILIHPRAIDQFWFLYALFNVSILYGLLRYKIQIPKLLHICLALLFYYLSNFVQEYDLLHDLLYYYIFLVLGTFTTEFFLNKENYRLLSSNKLILTLTPVFAISQWYWLTSTDINSFLFAGIALIGCFYILCFAFILQKHDALKALRIIGYHSLYIYLLHVLITSAVRILAIKIGFVYVPVLLIINILLGVYIPILFYNVARIRGLIILFEPKKKPAPQLEKKASY